MSPITDESDEVLAHRYRLAQAARFLRFCDERDVDPRAVLAGRVTPDLDPICDERGVIVPGDVDYRSSQRKQLPVRYE